MDELILNKKDLVNYDEFLEAMATLRSFGNKFPRSVEKRKTKSVHYPNLLVLTRTPKSIYRLPIPTRAMNVFKEMDKIHLLEDKTEDLAKITLTELLNTPCAGHKTINEFQELCLFVHLKMRM